jgi:hypothetical protein
MTKAICTSSIIVEPTTSHWVSLAELARNHELRHRLAENFFLRFFKVEGMKHEEAQRTTENLEEENAETIFTLCIFNEIIRNLSGFQSLAHSRFSDLSPHKILVNRHTFNIRFTNSSSLASIHKPAYAGRCERYNAPENQTMANWTKTIKATSRWEDFMASDLYSLAVVFLEFILGGQFSLHEALVEELTKPEPIPIAERIKKFFEKDENAKSLQELV